MGVGKVRKKRATIAVSIPTFNRIDLLKRTLKSVFAQTEPPDEIIVIDDGSTDGTWEYLKTIKGIKAYRNKKNLGMIENWNETIKRAKSEYVVSLHSDDLILSDYIKVWREKIASAGDEVAAYFSAGYIIDGNDRVSGLVQPFPKDLLLRPPQTLRYFWKNFRFYLSVTGWTLYKKKVIKQAGYFTRNYNIAAENEMTMKILPSYPVYYCSQPIFAFRRHELQGFEGKVTKFSTSQEVKNISDAYRVLFDYKNRPEITKSFSKEEIKRSIFMRKPIAYLIPQSIYRLFFLDIKRTKAYFTLFLKHYPRPYFDLATVKLLMQWSVFLVKTFLKNLAISYKMKNKKLSGGS